MTANQTGKRRRWWPIVLALLLVVVVGVVVASRVVLPTVVRRLLLQRAQELNARIDVGTADLSLWWGGLVIHDIAVRSANPPAKGPDTPLIQCKRLALGWRWRPLLSRTVRLRTVEIDEPKVVLDRLADGDFNLAALLPKPKPKPKAGSAPAPSPEWTVTIDRLILSHGGIRFRDLAVDDSAPMDASLDRIEVARIAFAPGQYGRSTRLHLDLAVEDGRVDVGAQLALHPRGLRVAARVRAQRLPLARTRLYAPELGWSDLGGRLGADLRYTYVPDATHTLTGPVTLTDVAVHVPQVEQPALSAKRLTGTLAPIDFRRQRVTLDQVKLVGGALPLDPRAEAPVPLVAGSPAAAPASGPRSPWSVFVKALAVSDSHVVVANPYDAKTPALVGLEVSTKDALLSGDGRIPLRVVARTDAASATFDGQTRIDAFDLNGELTLHHVALPAVVDTLGWLPPAMLQAGHADGTLHVTAGGRSGDVEVTGTASVADLWIAADDPHEFSVGAKRVSGTIAPLRIPGVGRAKVTEPTVIGLRDLQLDAPYTELTRTPTGWLGPRREKESAADATKESATPGLKLDIERAHLSGARGFISDRTVTPFFIGGLDPFDADVQHFAWPAVTVAYLQIDGYPPERGQLALRGWLVPAGSQVNMETTDVALPPFNPYVVTYSGYSVPRGRVSGTASAWFGEWGWDLNSHLRLHDFDLAGGGGDALFREHFGISLAVGLAALRDGNGDIALEVPLSVDAAGARVGVSTVLSNAVERALVNLLSTPRKLLGALVSPRGGAPDVSPAPIEFAAGRTVPLEGGIKQLAAFLASRPGVSVTLFGDGTKRDLRWLAEAALAEKLHRGDRLTPPADKPTTQRLLAALRDRADDKPGELSDDDNSLLDRWIADAPLPPEQLQALAAARLEAVRGTLAQRFGLSGKRVSVRPPTTAVDDGVPAVLLQFGPVGD